MKCGALERSSTQLIERHFLVPWQRRKMTPSRIDGKNTRRRGSNQLAKEKIFLCQPMAQNAG